MEDLDKRLCQLITAFHVLHNHEVLNEHGQISLRNPRQPSTFFISNVPPILVSSKEDFDLWNVTDGLAVSASHRGSHPNRVPDTNSEHVIHSCLYHRFPGVNSIIHSHSPSSIVYGHCDSSGSMLRPTYQMAAFLGQYLPIFDAANYYPSLPQSTPQNLMITNRYLGDALAEKFCGPREMNGSPEVDGLDDLPSYSTVLQRGHGFTTCAQELEVAAFNAIHLSRNAEIQTAAMVQRFQTDLEVVYLSVREAKDCETTLSPTVRHSWSAWATEVERQPLYRNELQSLR